MQNTIQQQSLKNKYDTVNVCTETIQYTQPMRLDFAYEQVTLDLSTA